MQTIRAGFIWVLILSLIGMGYSIAEDRKNIKKQNIAASQFTLVVLPDGTVKFIVGDGTITTFTGQYIFGKDGLLKGISNAVAVATSAERAGLYLAVLLSDGTIRTWGTHNGSGALGDGTNVNKPTLAKVKGISNAVTIAAGVGMVGHSLALLSDGTVMAWGYNDDGQLGDGTDEDRSTPVKVKGISNAVAIAAGDEHSMALLSDGTVMAWGHNFMGQLGNGSEEYESYTPVKVKGISNAVAIAAGNGHSMALLSDGTVMTWGENDKGQLGDGTTKERRKPVTVTGISKAVAVSAGVSHSMALLSDGTVMTWGNNWIGQLGDGTIRSSHIPVKVIGISDAVEIVAGDYHNVALLKDGTIKGWGMEITWETTYDESGKQKQEQMSPTPVTIFKMPAIENKEKGNKKE